MLEFNAQSLIDHDALRDAIARLDDFKQRLMNATAAVRTAKGEVSRTWDSSVAAMAAGGDAMAGAEDHGAAVRRCEFAEKMVAVAEKNLAEEQERFERARILAHVPVLKKGRELRLASAKAYDELQRRKTEVDALAQHGSKLMAAAQAAGLKHFNPASAGRGARSEAEETEFLAAEAAGARAFWGMDL